MNATDPKDELDERKLEEISNFVIRKRKDVVLALYKYGEVPQRELANLIGSTPTSLANILVKFERFEPKLLVGKSVGKQRLYSLSDLGRSYARTIDAGNAEQMSDVLEHEELTLIQKGKDCLSKIRQLCTEDDWELVMDDVLLDRIHGIRSQSDEQVQAQVDRFLETMELIILKGFDTAPGRLLAALGNSILVGRIEAFMNYLYPFLFVIRALEDEDMTYSIYDMLNTSIQGCGPGDMGRFVTDRGWVEDYKKLSETFVKIKRIIAGYDKEEIFGYITKIIPQNKALCVYIADVLWREQNK